MSLEKFSKRAPEGRGRGAIPNVKERGPMRYFYFDMYRRRVMEKMVVHAKAEELESVNAFIQKHLEQSGCPVKVQMQVALAVEEIFVNISSYAYHPKTGEAEISVDVDGDPSTVTIRFMDQGYPFNPLEKPDTDTTLSAEKRGVGGLGILLVKKTMDHVAYTYEDGRNILTITKEIK